LRIIIYAIYAYVKLEKLKLVTNFNHFSMKTKIYMASMMTERVAFQGTMGKHSKPCLCVT